MKSQPRRYTSEQRASIARGFASWRGSREAYAAAVGVPKTTLHRMLARAGVPTAASQPPAMLEVIPVPPAASRAPAAVAARLVLPGGAELHLDALPPAGWVAELAAGLARC